MGGALANTSKVVNVNRRPQENAHLQVAQVVPLHPALPCACVLPLLLKLDGVRLQLRQALHVSLAPGAPLWCGGVQQHLDA